MIKKEKKKHGTITQWNTMQSLKKRGNLTFCDIIDRPGDYYTK